MDDVQIKLSQIDRELSLPANFYQGLISRYPLLLSASGFLTGILIQRHLALSILFWVALAFVGSILSILIFILYKRADKPYILAYIGCCCFLCLGAVRLAHFSQPSPDSIRNFVGEEKILATVRGTVITQPYVNDNPQWQFAKFAPGDPKSSFYLQIKEVKAVDGWRRLSGTIAVYVSEPVMDIRVGDYVQIDCWLAAVQGADNPGQFDFAQFLEASNIYICADVKNRDAITLLENEKPFFFAKAKSHLAELANKNLLSASRLDSGGRGLLAALLLGYRSDIDNQTSAAFQRTGLFHLISLSGMNLAILVSLIWWLCRIAGLLKPARAVVGIIVITLFLLVVPPRAPIIRAAVICYIYFISIFFTRTPNPLNSLSLAVIVTLMMSPLDVYNAGWQLSFASVAGILLFTDKINLLLNGWLSLIPFGGGYYQWLKKILSILIMLFSVGVAAWLGSAGILLYHFYTVITLSSLWTVVVFPFVDSIVILGYLKIIFSLLLPTVGGWIGFVLGAIVKILVGLVKLIAAWDVSSILIGHVSAWLIIAYYLTICFALFAALRNKRLKNLCTTAMILLLIASIGFTKWQRNHRNDLVLSCLDVGHGQAVVVQMPQAGNYIFDAGSLSSRNLGGRVVNPFLDYAGIDKLDAIFISHNDTDHINGIPEITDHCKINRVFASPAFFSNDDMWGTSQFLRGYLAEKKISSLSLKTDAKINNAIEVLWPDEAIASGQNLSDNDRSSVILINYSGRKILFCSDIEKFAQAQLLKLYPALKVDILIAPHHGSARTIDEEFIKQLQPQILVTSCATSDYQKQRVFIPADNIESYYTSNSGMIEVRITKDGIIKVSAFRRASNK